MDDLGRVQDVESALPADVEVIEVLKIVGGAARRDGRGGRGDGRFRGWGKGGLVDSGSGWGQGS